MKVTIDGFISYSPHNDSFWFHPIDMDAYGYITVQPHKFDVEIPDDFDPRAKQIDGLKAEKLKLMADFQKRCTEIEAKISELTAIECV